VKIEDVKVLIVRAPGTNCDYETAQAFKDLGTRVEIVPIYRIFNRNVKILDYDILVFPGGFSYGDFIRAGAVLGKKLIAKIEKDIKEFIKDGRPILGICNGFQILVEAGLIPGIENVKIALTTNLSLRYECRWTILKFENNRSILSNYINIGEMLKIPIGHGEGRLIVSSEKDLKELIDNNLIVFRYVKPNGEYANGEYPWNPNGSIYDIAGLCNIYGNVIGMMPHPERAFYRWQFPDWTRDRGKIYIEVYGDGYKIIKGIIDYVCSKF